MRTILKLFLVLVLFFSSNRAQAQQDTLDSIQELKEVIVYADRLLKPFSKTQITQVLSDSVIKRNVSSLTQLLSFSSPIYFKENGLGMVSSPSFRGTSAQQTAVVWNGININSQFNGQTDFNTINTRNFDNITIRHGGGSVLYGTGAIGGTVHLNDVIAFNTPFKNSLYAGIGSFNTQDISYNSKYASDRLSVGFALAHTHSDNDYKYEFRNRERTNLNGQFYNVSFSTKLGYKINSKHKLHYYNYVFNGERHFSLILPTETPTKYNDFNTRQLLEWETRYGKFLSVLRAAYLTERYKYFGNIESDNFTFGEANTVVGNYQLNYNWDNSSKLVGVIDVNHTEGKGSSIDKTSRTISSFSLLFNQQLKLFYYEASLRKEITNAYESPLLFSLGLKRQFVSWYALSLNGSRNFRIPTFNDLYWQGSGNLDLNPEKAYQVEISNTFLYRHLEFNIAGFFNDIKDMIRWVPNNSGVWRPINTEEVMTYGLESQLTYKLQKGAHQLVFNTNYAYTVSEDKTTEKQLIYVPYHKGSGGMRYAYKKVSAYWQTSYVGEVFTQSDNNPNRIVEAYWLHNLGVELKMFKALTIGIRIQNIFNNNYQSVANRYMPGINTNFYLNYKF